MNLDREMKNAAVRFNKWRAALDRDWESFRKIDIAEPSARKALEGIKARALKLAQKASADSDISLDHFELELDAHCLVDQAGEAADEAQMFVQQIEQSLANPRWRNTMKIYGSICPIASAP